MKSEPSLKKLLTVPEVAFRLGIGRTLAYRLVMQGHIPSIALGRARRVPAAALDEFIAERLREQAAERWADELRLRNGGGWDD